jgi:hypothetical protein
MLIQVAIRGEQNEFARWYIWMIFGTWILMVAYWLNRIDTGLKLYPPLFIIPVMQVFFVFFAIVCGGIYFREFDEFTSSQWIGFSIGVFMILAGVYGLAPPDLVLITPDDEDEKNLDNKNNEDTNIFEKNKPLESDIETGPSLTEEQTIKREILALEKKLKSIQISSQPCLLSDQISDENVRTKPTPAPKLSVNSTGTVLVSYKETDNNNNEHVSTSSPSPSETSVSDPVPQINNNNSINGSNKSQGVVLPPINRNESLNLNSSPSNKKSRKVIKRRPLNEAIISGQP